MGSEPSAPRWLARALITCLARLGQVDEQLFDGTDWTKVRALREVGIWDEEGESRKRLDLVVTDGNFVLGVENKIYAAVDNPFTVYDKLLEQRANGGPILRCVLHAMPNTRFGSQAGGWPIVSYGELVQVALSQYGEEVSRSSVSKWEVFYREFLLHLRNLSQPSENNAVEEKNLDFAMENLPRLIKASDLLNQLESGLRRAGTATLEKRFLSEEVTTTIRTGVANWPHNEKALRFFPSIWGGESQVVLVYYPNTSHESKRSIRLYVTAYIDRDYAAVPLDEIKRRFEEATLRDTHSWLYIQGEDLTWPERKGQLLALSAWAREESKEGALQALTDLAMWVHRCAFTRS